MELNKSGPYIFQQFSTFPIHRPIKSEKRATETIGPDRHIADFMNEYREDNYNLRLSVKKIYPFAAQRMGGETEHMIMVIFKIYDAKY